MMYEKKRRPRPDRPPKDGPETGDDDEARRPLRLSAREDGVLLARVDGRDVSVEARRCFPWSAPDRFISIRDFEGEEVWLIEDLAELDEETHALVAGALAATSFVFEITAVESIETQFEIRNWTVRTIRGARTFQTLRTEWPREIPGGGTLVRDVSGDLYRIPDPSKLDKKSQEILWAFVD